MRLFSRARKKNRFLELLTKQAELTVQGLDCLRRYLREPNAKLIAELNRAEKEGDEMRRTLVDELNNTFVTPFDREDIFALSLNIDDILDYADTTMEEINLFGVVGNHYIERIVSLLADASLEIYRGVQELQDNPKVASDHAIRAKALENRVEHVYREALADLFKTPKDFEGMVQILKLREIYRHLSNAADQGDEAADVIGDIVVKWL
jgi:predicted phosphate transport protein (TIGR00153 family)